MKSSGPGSRPKPWVVNVGLPRTGTTSFTRAAELLGLRALHVWDEAEDDADLLRAVRENKAACRRFLSKYHALADAPFFALRETFETHYPETRLVYTTRPRQAWLQSMIRSHNKAGGDFLARMYGLRGIPWREKDRAGLMAAYDAHHESVCRGLPAVDLAGSDSERWKIFCSCLPDPEKHLKRAREWAWPHENRGKP